MMNSRTHLRDLARILSAIASGGDRNRSGGTSVETGAGKWESRKSCGAALERLFSVVTQAP